MKVMIHVKKHLTISRITPVLLIKRKDFNTSFTFRETNFNDDIKFIKNLILSKACQSTDIHTKIIKLNADTFANYIFKNYNYCLENGKFSCVLKHADVASVHKKKEKKTINLSKIYEKLIYH